MKVQLPECVTARRVGHWSMGSENEYDADGEQAPVRWICNCGSWMVLEYVDRETDRYVPVSDAAKAEFLADHGSCGAPKCFKCHAVPVDRQGGWCEPCSDKEDEVDYDF